MLGVLIGVGGAIILVSITLFAIMCCRVKYEKFSRQLLGASASVSAKGKNGGSSLLLAAEFGRLEAVEFLIVARGEVPA